MFEVALTAFATLIVIIDPIALAPIFFAITRDMTAARRRYIALRACLISLGILILFGLVGEQLLRLIGIGMPAFRISGGILLLLTAIDMLFDKRTARREQTADEPPSDPSVFPLATPLIAGPGAMTTMILLVGEQSGNPLGQFMIFGILTGVILATYLMLMLGGRLDKILGATGINVITRLLGMLLAALAVQFMLDGLRDFGMFGG